MNRSAKLYANALGKPSGRVREMPASANELTWQTRWFSGAFGRSFTAEDGQQVVIEDFGEWNREAGPDFVKASVRTGRNSRIGAVEVDMHPGGWEQHGHSTNPAYEDVVLHVVVQRAKRHHFTRTLSHRSVPRICLADHPCGETEWEPGAPARPGRCMAPLRMLSDDRLNDLLRVAARRRMEIKGRLLAAMIESRGADTALFEALAIAMGYKNNKFPFQLLAQRVPRRLAASPRGEALLFGLAGFLERPEPKSGGGRKHMATLWHTWWKMRAGFTRLILMKTDWRLAGLRPANHPARRLGALAAIAKDWRRIRPALEKCDLAMLQDVLGQLAHPFWSFHLAWNSPRKASPLALIGPERISDIFINIALPLAIANGREPSGWDNLPAKSGNATLKVVSARLFGGRSPRTLRHTLCSQQGLLQIYEDFCLRDHGECADCRFPGLVTHLTA